MSCNIFRTFPPNLHSLNMQWLLVTDCGRLQLEGAHWANTVAILQPFSTKVLMAIEDFIFTLLWLRHTAKRDNAGYK